MDIVESVETEKTVETEETVESVETVECVELQLAAARREVTSEAKLLTGD